MDGAVRVGGGPVVAYIDAVVCPNELRGLVP
jgi:hypothetical protein